MSWKGFQKAVVRAPQQVKGKLNIGENTVDAAYIDVENQFKELELKLRKLLNNAKKYLQSITDILSYQMEFAVIIEEIYKPITGKSTDIENKSNEECSEAVDACQKYRNIVKELQEILTPELEMIESRIIAPTSELLSIIASIHKITEKRERKRLDYDRHRSNLKKLQDKKEKTLKDERALYSAENVVEQSTQEYEYYNTLLKEELPILFGLEINFIQPLFQNLYYIQLNIYYTLYEKMKCIDIGYFDLNREIVEGFELKRNNIQEITESLGIVRFTLSRRSRCVAEADNSKPAKLSPTSSHLESNVQSEELPSYYDVQNLQNYQTNYGNNIGESSNANNRNSNIKKIPPPLPCKPTLLKGKECAVALYDYEAQMEGDLSFKAGDRIEIIKKTDKKNDWWTGRLNGVEGVFPGNYTVLEQS
ncbi:hypothetical protein T552_01372 [Pneumocystis carinii B80]|uniref:BAR domain-containing protein n=1 Tax=Pneumocystis carinii (strain B80) TaxID=1408658 RepID=A0A0W4ZM13_PNEC8|nr:hypothetical protein T552_01372 [Pneumocystis carinii B80]KTW29421.1 hypothetical protein T552_01372 [Pneumocystis carinii B80]